MIVRMLREISDNFETLGGQGRVGFSVDWPVTVTLADGQVYRATVTIHWTEHGPEIVDLESQALRIAQEIGHADGPQGGE